VLISESALRATRLFAPEAAVFVAEIACLMCSRFVGIAIATRWPPVGVVLLQPAGSATLHRCAVGRLRCLDCGGNTAAAEVERRSIRAEKSVDWQAMERRRGRPPRWLVAQREAARLLLEHAQA